MSLCYIGIGANLGDAKTTVKQAIQQLGLIPQTKLVKASSLYISKPMGPADQNDYVNAVAAINTTLAPLDLLDATQAIELNYGRERKDERWGPRTLDLDILLFGNEQINQSRLVVPHYGMTEREFVLYPLYELTPQLCLPDGTTLASLIENIPLNGMIKDD